LTEKVSLATKLSEALWMVISLFRPKRWEIALAMRYLRTRRKDGGIAVIAMISFVGIALSVLALVAVLSIMNGFREELMSRMLAFNGHAYLYGQPLLPQPKRVDLIKRLKAVDGVVSVVPQLDSPGLVQSSTGALMPAYMRGISPNDLKAKDIITQNLSEGSSLAGFGAGDYGGDVILIGIGIAQNLGLRVGEELTLMSPGGATVFGAAPIRKTYKIGGIFQSGVSEIDKSFVYLPLEQAQLFFDREDEWDSLEIKVSDPYKIATYREALALAAGEGSLIEDWAERNAAVWSALKIERTAMRFILFFIVIIATMNIVSGIVMLVKNKTRDIAILRTMGADRMSIARIFFMTGTLIGVFGTVLGLILGVLFSLFIRPIQETLEWVFQTKLFDPSVYYLSHVPAKMEVGEIVFIVLASVLAAMIASLFPALWASKMEPVEALRYE